MAHAPERRASRVMSYLTLFTIPKGFTDPHVSLIQRNALASWRALAPDVEVIVMGDDPGVAEAAGEFGATHYASVARNEFGTPLLDSAFREAAARATGELLCYMNADIILLEDFLAAARRLPQGSYLAIGRRWDCDITSRLTSPRAARSSPPGRVARARSTRPAAATTSSSPCAPTSDCRRSRSDARAGTTG